MLTISQVQTDEEITTVREIMHEYIKWAFNLDGRSVDAPTMTGIDDERKTLPGVYAPPTGCLLLATFDGKPSGHVCFNGHDAHTCELKRLYVHPEFRGKNIGSYLVGKLLEQARQSGYQRMILDSHGLMTKAHEIYEAHGFDRVEAPDDYPEAIKAEVAFMECDLTATS